MDAPDDLVVEASYPCGEEKRSKTIALLCFAYSGPPPFHEYQVGTRLTLHSV